MKKLSYPDNDNLALWDSIVSNKHKTSRKLLQTVRDKVSDRYSFYYDHFNNLNEIKPLPAEEWGDVAENLRSCFGNNLEFNKIKKLIKKKLSESGVTKCPYCMLSRPNTIDHYFDKSEYPEYSVYIPNLVPCCSECNTEKGTKIFDSENNRLFIHFYHDNVPQEQFLFFRFTLSEEDQIPNVNIYLSFNIENELTTLIKRHFLRLNLLQKYKDEVIDKFSTIVDEIKQYHAAGMSNEIIRQVLEGQYEAQIKRYGKNHLESCVYEGLLFDPSLLTLIY